MLNSDFWQGKRVFVTGATGLLGSHLTRLLVNLGADVIVLVRDATPRSLFYSSDPDWNFLQKVTIVRGELENAPLLERVVNEYEIDSVFHLAAQTIVGTANRSPLATFKSNIEGTWNLLEACRLHQKRIERIIVASSDKAYGDLKGGAYNESFPLAGKHPYDVSKSCADLISTSYFHTYGLPVAITRCGNFFGPGDLNRSRIVPGTINSILMGKSPIIRSNGTFVRDYIYAEDGAYAYLTLAEQMTQLVKSENISIIPHSGEAFNFSYGLRLTVKDIVDKILSLMGRKDLIPTVLNEAINEIPVQCLDSTKARSLLQWKPRFGFEEGLKMTIDWHRSQGAR